MEAPTTSVSVDAKVNLGNYQSASVFVSVSGIPIGASEAEIKKALETSELTFQLIKSKVYEKAKELKGGS